MSKEGEPVTNMCRSSKRLPEEVVMKEGLSLKNLKED